MTKYWLIKSEPSVYSIDDLKKDKKTYWDGVHNYQARNFLRDEMKKGDKVIFYHSNSEPIGAVGVCKVIKGGYPDFTAFDPDDLHYDPKSNKEKPTWYMVDVKFLEKFPRIVTLAEMKANPKLANMKLVQKGNRLSVMPITKKEFDEIVRMGRRKIK
jgi:predicted RNA-binding protein with PUA-like domain